MSTLHYHTGNRMEPLVEALAAVVAEPLPAGPLAQEVIIVQSLGMSRWVAMQLARRHGLAMNVAFPFPKGYLDATLGGLTGPTDGRLAPERMTWMIHESLPGWLDDPAFAPVQRYLRQESDDPLKYYQLATRIARLFDQYLVYRPELLLQWEREPLPERGEAAWQARLWRTVTGGGEARHLGHLLERLREAPPPPGQRLCIFGISSLPPAQVELFFHLAATRPVHLFLLSPSQEYFGDDLTPRQRARRGLPAPGPDDGNPLLTSLGRLNAHFIEELLECDERQGHRLVHEQEHWVEPEGEDRLHRLQRDLFYARPPAPAPEGASTRDESIAVHVCHSPMREVEVLYDQLLAMFEADPELQPSEILVMAPDIESYAPLISAVFGFPEEPDRRIPFSIADRHPRSENPVIELFLQLLELPGTRATAPQLYGLFQNGTFRRRFALEEGELEAIHDWMLQSGIRWGFDAAHRESFGLPAFEEASWRHGIDRLLLGYATSGGDERLFESILPLDDMEAGDAELLGRFITIIQHLAELMREATLPRALGEWVPLLDGVLETFFGQGSDAREAEALRRLRGEWGRGGRFEEIAQSITQERETAGGPIAFEVVREAIKAALGEAEHHGRFLSGGVTFCALKPMRSIPAKVIWLLGMNDKAFPRRNTVVQFDLIARHWKRGDRSPRDDDRYLFLEALLSARERLGISYIGRNQQTNEPIPPSIVISELFETLAAAGTPREAIEQVHPLQAFSRRYYEAASPLWSYSRANAVHTGEAPPPHDPFCPEPLPPSFPDAISLPDLIRFFENPAAFFLRHRLGLSTGERQDWLGESEPLVPDRLESSNVRSALLYAAVEGRPQPGLAVWQARSLIGPGGMGRAQFGIQAERTQGFYRRIAPWLGPPQEPETFRISLPNGGVLSGVITPIRNGRYLLLRPGRIRAKDRLRVWLTHLARAMAALREGTPMPLPSLLLAEDRVVEYAFPNDGETIEAIWETWRDAFEEGMQSPLPFFPEVSYAYAKAWDKGPEAALAAARGQWLGNSYQGAAGEGMNQSVRLCFEDDGILSSEQFGALALALWEPLIKCEQTAEGGEA